MAPERGMIVALTRDRVIGTGGTIPWHYSADMKRFKSLTVGKTIIMGRLTWESLPRKPLPKRRNIVVTSHDLTDVECYPSIKEALATCVDEDVWFVGGARIYAAAMPFASVIDLTWVPDTVPTEAAVRFPALDDAVWECGDPFPHPDDPRLTRQLCQRRKPI